MKIKNEKDGPITVQAKAPDYHKDGFKIPPRKVGTLAGLIANDAHPDGICESETCQDCCQHEFDASEGFECLNCGKQGLEGHFDYYED